MASNLSENEEKIYVYAKLLGADHKSLHKVASRLSHEKKEHELKQHVSKITEGITWTKKSNTTYLISDNQKKFEIEFNKKVSKLSYHYAVYDFEQRLDDVLAWGVSTKYRYKSAYIPENDKMLLMALEVFHRHK